MTTTTVPAPEQMRESIAICQSLPERGPVVITPTFVGYLVAGFWGSLLSTVGTFLPSFLLVLIVAPLGARHRENANVQGFVKGAYAAATGWAAIAQKSNGRQG